MMQDEIADLAVELATALKAARQQLEGAHAEAFPGCDGTCSYHDAIRMADKALGRADHAGIEADLDRFGAQLLEPAS